jgi:tetratricopeptide (TPR) repeat protein
MKHIILIAIVFLLTSFHETFTQERDNVGHRVGPWSISRHTCFNGISWKLRKSYYSDNSDSYTNEIQITNTYGSTISFSYTFDAESTAATKYRKTLSPGQTYTSTYCQNVHNVYFIVEQACFNNGKCNDDCYAQCDSGAPNQPDCSKPAKSEVSSTYNNSNSTQTYSNNTYSNPSPTYQTYNRPAPQPAPQSRRAQTNTALAKTALSALEAYNSSTNSRDKIRAQRAERALQQQNQPQYQPQQQTQYQTQTPVRQQSTYTPPVPKKSQAAIDYEIHKDKYIELVNNGIKSYNSKNLSDAFLQFYKASDLLKTDSSAALYTAIVSNELKYEDYAISHYRRYLDNGGNQISIYNDLAKIYTKRKQNQEVTNILQEGVNGNPSSSDLRFELINHYGRIEEYQNQIEEIKIALLSYEDNLILHQIMGQAHNILNKTEDAIHWYKKTLELDPKHAETLQELGSIYFNLAKKATTKIIQCKNYKESLIYFKRASISNPNDTSLKSLLSQTNKALIACPK